MANIMRMGGSGVPNFTLRIIVPDDLDSVECFKVNDDGSTTELFDGGGLKVGWNLYTTINGGDIVQNEYVVPDVVTTFEVTAESTSNNLDYYSWQQVISLAESGVASSYLNVGDTKDFTDKAGNTQTMIIVGFDHDDKSDGSGKAGISFHGLYVYKDATIMTTSTTNSAGWPGSYIKSTKMPYIYNSVIPNDIVGSIKEVTKSTGKTYYSTSNYTTEDYIWLPSFTEVGASGSSYNTPDLSTVYDYYRDGGSTARIKTTSNGTAVTWWLRSPYSINSNAYGSVTTSGGIYYTSIIMSATDYVVFGFCI